MRVRARDHLEVSIVKISGAKALIESLRREKVDVAFGIPGGAIMPVYDELLDSSVRHILARHEQAAAHMADGYARASGRPGVCIATSGPGATNLVTGIATAHMDSSPIVAFTGQVPASQIGTDAFQEADIVGIVTPITKYWYSVNSASEIPRVTKEAFHIASTGRPGPVLVDIPRDAQVETADVTFPLRINIRGYQSNGSTEQGRVKEAARLLAQAEKPFILAGGGTRISNASRELQALAELLGAPVGTSLMGKGTFREDHPLSVGMVGMHGTEKANVLVRECDVLLVVGMRFSDRTTGRADEFCKRASIIQIDLDPSEVEKNKEVALHLIGDAAKTLASLRQHLSRTLKQKGSRSWFKRILQEQIKNAPPSKDGLTPERILKTLRRILPDSAIITTEVGQNQMWAAMYFKAYSSRTFITSGGLGTMGFGFPAAIGAKVAKPNTPVIDIAGDGSFMMSDHCLATSIREKIPVTVIILNNGMLGMVAQLQRLFFNGRYSAVELGRIPDFVKLAEAYSAQGFRIESIKGFEKAVKTGLKSDITTVIDVPISPEENVLPIVPPGSSLDNMMMA